MLLYKWRCRRGKAVKIIYVVPKKCEYDYSQVNSRNKYKPITEKRISYISYRIKQMPNKKPKVMHCNRLAPVMGDNNDGRLKLQSITPENGPLPRNSWKYSVALQKPGCGVNPMSQESCLRWPNK